MRATVMNKAHDVSIATVPNATIQQPTDAVIRITRACICGSDLWPYNGGPNVAGQQMGHEAIGVVDERTDSYPAYYMINCAHPDHFEVALDGEADWAGRIRGLRANASRMSHEELDAAPELDEGDPVELGSQYAALRAGGLPNLNVMGGCCGTDHRHIEAIAAACLPIFRGAK